VVVVVRITGYLFPVGKIAKKSVWRGTQNTVPYCQKYTPTDNALFGDFAHWVSTKFS